jgi:hypothetical protein
MEDWQGNIVIQAPGLSVLRVISPSHGLEDETFTYSPTYCLTLTHIYKVVNTKQALAFCTPIPPHRHMNVGHVLNDSHSSTRPIASCHVLVSGTPPPPRLPPCFKQPHRESLDRRSHYAVTSLL